jgi:prephenate dehydrogenase
VRVGVAGLGLIGGSIARGLSAAGHCVTGLDTAGVVARARRAGAIAEAATTIGALAAEADVVILAAPPRANLRLLRALAARPGEAIVTDVGSVKAPICAEASRLAIASFVGGHPMAGSEKSGFGASDASLFAGRSWILTPAAGRRPPRRLLELIRALGARPVVTTAREHDRAVAFLSHVPQIVAWSLADAAARDPVARKHARLAGPGFADMTRLARSSPRLWREILASNRAEVVRALDALRRALAHRAPR